MDTRCPICSNTSLGEVCPDCGEDLRKWREWDVCAERLACEGIAYAETGHMHRALLALAKATFLKPDEPLVLKAMGDVLAAVQDYDMSVYYYERCASAPRASRSGLAAEAMAALARVNTLRSRSGPDGTHQRTCLLELEEMPRVELSTLASSRGAASVAASEGAPDSTVTSAASIGAWKAVIALEDNWQTSFSNLEPLLSCLAPRPPAEGALHYLGGLLALSRQDISGAKRCFQQAVVADSSRRNPEIYLMFLGSTNGELAEVVRFLRSQRRTNGDILSTIHSTALVLLRRKQTAEAAQLLRDGFRELPSGIDDTTRAEVENLLANIVSREGTTGSTEPLGNCTSANSLPGMQADKTSGPVQDENAAQGKS